MLGRRCDVHDVKLRAARPSDAAAVASLAGELGYPACEKEVSERLAALSVSSEDAVFVAVLGLTPVAWIHVTLVTLLESARHAEIRGLVVTAALRAHGIGAQLVEHAEGWARERGVSRIRVRSNAMRERTHAFYERLGYGVVKTQKVFDKPL
jgi:GNAT superfamily N-acetyltransferase